MSAPREYYARDLYEAKVYLTTDSAIVRALAIATVCDKYACDGARSHMKGAVADLLIREAEARIAKDTAN